MKIAPDGSLGLLFGLLAALGLAAGASAQDARQRQPNLLVVVVDDLRWDDLGCMGHPFCQTPHIDRIAREGARFLNAFAVTPLCSPSRATLLTGRYPHDHGITDNTERSRQSHQLTTFPQFLQRAGYRTAFIGKWHMGNDNSPRPGFDHWACLQGQGSAFDPRLNVDGSPRQEPGYVTDILHRHAEKFVAQPSPKPFMLFYAHKALHPETVQRADGSLSDPGASRFVPAPRHEKLYAGQKPPRRPNAIAPPRGKPALERTIADLPPLGPQTGSSDATILDRLRMLAAVDESLGKLLGVLEKSGELDRTLVVVTSDHGYFYGEHGLSVERRLAYEEAIRIPLLMRLPGTIEPGSEPAQFVLTVDLVPTLLALGRAESPPPLPGRSLVPLFQGQVGEWRNDFLIEYFSDKVFPRMDRMGYRAIRNERWKLIHYLELPGMDELYDLQADPFEMHNLITAPAAADVLPALRARLAALAPAPRP